MSTPGSELHTDPPGAAGAPPGIPGGFRTRALPEPRAASPDARRLDPATGWLRRLERRANHFLSRTVYPRVPGMTRIYDRHMRRRLEIGFATVGIPGLPAAFDGARVLLATDLHAGPFIAPAILAEAVERCSTLRPDLVLLGGDLLSSRVEEFDRLRPALERLRAPLGAFAVLGNHDHYTRRPAEIRRAVESAGITVLHNRSVRVERDGATVSIAGIDDLLRGEPDLEAALADTTPPVILLSHNPDCVFDAAAAGVSLVLSGHTHGGQIRLPGFGPVIRQSRYELHEGRFRAGATELVVSRGLGAVGLPVRWNCPPEAVLLTLARSAGP